MAESRLLTVQGLCHTVVDGGRRHRILEDLALRLDPGEIMAVVGPSGSGKTTLLNLLAGLERAEAGSICLGDTCLEQLPPRELPRWRRRHIGFVFQFFNLIPTLNALENCLLPLELDGQRGDPQQARAVLAALGLEALQHRYPEQLSGGEQQRVAIARALLNRPALLLADEPTGNLDDATARDVADLLFAQLRGQQMSALIVTHSEALAARCDRRLTLRDGRLV